jgi:signal transduction histidine kinase
LRSLTAGMSTKATMVRAIFRTEIPRLDDGAELGIYRIAQEALSNALRHARARQVELALAASEQELRLEIRDDGCGFDPADRRAQALGLVSMEERAQALGGCFEVRSTAGKGTVVLVEIPLRAVVLPQTASR